MIHNIWQKLCFFNLYFINFSSQCFAYLHWYCLKGVVWRLSEVPNNSAEWVAPSIHSYQSNQNSLQSAVNNADCNTCWMNVTFFTLLVRPFTIHHSPLEVTAWHFMLRPGLLLQKICELVLNFKLELHCLLL